jgi:hypothetical protein
MAGILIPNYRRALDAIARFDRAVVGEATKQDGPAARVQVVRSEAKAQRVVDTSSYRTGFWGNLLLALERRNREQERRLWDEEGKGAVKEAVKCDMAEYFKSRQPPWKGRVIQLGEQWKGTLALSRKLIGDGSLLDGPQLNLVEDVIRLVEHGVVPVLFRGTYPNGYFVGYAPPGVEVPASWAPTPADLAAGELKKRTSINRRKLPVPDVPVCAAADAWPGWTGQAPAAAFRDFAGRMGASAAVVAALAERVVAVAVSGRGRTATLVWQLRGPDPKRPMELTCQPPWTGALDGLPIGLARVLRVSNGMELDIVRWLPYRGARGFAVAWADWEVADNADGLWTKPPLTPFTDGSDLWACHPARMRGDTLELVRIDHEGGTIEDEPEQDPATRFWQLVLERLA